MLLAVITFLLFSIILIASLLIWQGGTVAGEIMAYIPNYIDNRSLLAKIFDVKKNDIFGYYEARELSYFFDMIDSYFIKISAYFHHPHYFSLITFICFILIIWIGIYFGKIIKHRSYTISVFSIVAFLTTPTMFLGTLYFRSGKILTGLFLLLFIIFIFENRKNYLLLIVSTLLTLADRQGFYFTFVIGFVSFFIFIFTQKKDFLRYAVISLVAVIINTIYNFLLGPFLIKTFAGYWPSFEFQKLDFLKQINIKVINDTFFYTLDTFAYFFGSSRFLAVVFTGILIFYFIKLEPGRKNKLLKLAALAIFFAAIYVCNLIMIMKHSLILLPHVRISGYNRPVMVLILVFSLLATNRIIKSYPKSEQLLTIILFVIIGLNVFSLPRYFYLVRYTYDTDPTPQWTEQITTCIKSVNVPVEAFNLPRPYHENFCRALRPQK